MARQRLIILIFVCLGSIIYAIPQTQTITLSTYSETAAGLAAVFESNIFKQSFPYLRIELNVSDYLAHHNRLLVETPEADLVVVNGIYLDQVYKEERVLPLRLSSNDTNQNYPLYTSSLNFALDDGLVLKGIPFAVNPVILFYHQELLENHAERIQEIAFESWNEWFEAGLEYLFGASILENDTNILRRRSERPFVNSVWETASVVGSLGQQALQNGGSYLSHYRFGETFNLIRELRRYGMEGNLQKWSGQWLSSYPEESAVVEWGSSDLVQFFHEMYGFEDSGYRLSLLPGGNSYSQGDHYICMSKEIPFSLKRTASDLIRFLCSEEAQAILYSDGILFPAHSSGSFLDPYSPLFGGSSPLELARASMENIPSRTFAPPPVLWDNAISEGLETDRPSQEIFLEINSSE